MDTPSPWALPPQCVPEPIKFSNIIKLEKSKKEREKKQIVEDFNFAMALSASEPPSQTAPTVETDEDGACSSKSVINSLSIPNVVESKTDDSVIAQLLQAEFDLEFDEEIKRLEQSRNKNSKVTVSLANYRLYPDELLQNDSDKEDEDLVDARRSKNWDRFEKNQKEISKIGKSGYRADAHGNVLTKHDEVLIGRKNAGKIMEQLNYGIPSGDCGNFDMKVSNKVFNELRAHSNMIAKKTNQTALDRRENIKTAEMGMDEKTRLILYKLINQGILDVVDGVVSTGKEAVILHADTQQGNEDYPDLPKEVAIKIFSTTLNEFKQRDRYIRDDYRFKDNMKSGRNLISKWCEKEFHNLSRLKKAEIPCPDVVLMKKHILVMSYIGSGHTSPAPKLKDVQFTSQEELVGAYQEVIDIMKRMYRQARLVHADFSEYNILWHEGHCVIIDMAQSVEPIHPSALEFLMRDCGNITSFFEKRGVPPDILLSKEQLFFDITQLDPLTTNTTMLERIHMKGEPEHIINRPQNIDGNNESEKVPEKYRLSQFPFDYAWKKVEELKEKSKAESLSDEPPKETEWAEVKSKKRNKRKSESKTIIDNDIADGLKLISMTSN